MSETCPVCGCAATLPIDRQDGVPVMLNRLYRTREAALASPVGRLDMVACGGCGFVWNRAFDPGLIRYDGEYENDQTYSAVFHDHVTDVARRVIAAAPPGPLHVVEVGCGQGTFLRRIAAIAGDRLASATGFDPAWRGDDGPTGEPSLSLYRRYFGAETAALLPAPPTVVVSRHTIEHVPDPVAFLRAIRAGCGSAPVRLVVETPCVGWILRTRAFQDFFYEHCSLFTADSLALALELAGFGAVEVGHVFGGQYLVAVATAGAPPNSSRRTPAVPESWCGARAAFVDRWRAEVAAARVLGPVALWGGGAKGATFAYLVDPAGELLSCAIDINIAKQGGFLPVTGLPVVSPATAAAIGVKAAFVMNPNYIPEIERLVRHLPATCAYSDEKTGARCYEGFDRHRSENSRFA